MLRLISFDEFPDRGEKYPGLTDATASLGFGTSDLCYALFVAVQSRSLNAVAELIDKIPALSPEQLRIRETEQSITPVAVQNGPDLLGTPSLRFANVDLRVAGTSLVLPFVFAAGRKDPYSVEGGENCCASSPDVCQACASL